MLSNKSVLLDPDSGSFFLCKYSSWYHLLGVCSFFESLVSKPECIIFYTGSFFGKCVMPPRELLETYGSKVHFVDNRSDAISLLVKYNIKKERVFLLNPSRRPIMLSYAIRRSGFPLHIVFIEEGLGYYGGILQDVKAFARENFRSVRLPLVLKLVLSMVIVLIGNSFFFGTRSSCWSLFDRETLELNLEVRHSYLCALQKLADHMPQPMAPEGSGFITIVVTGPYSELGQLANSDEREILDYACSQVLDSSTVLIKPHPIECPKKYEGYSVIDPSIPLELYLFYFKSRVASLLMISSTSAYTSKVLFGLTIKRIEKFDLFHESLSRKQKKLISISAA